MAANNLIRENIDEFASDLNEKTKELDQKENKAEKEKENQFEEEDEKLEDFLKLKCYSTNSFYCFSESIFVHLNSRGKHIGDTFTPPPDLS